MQAAGRWDVGLAAPPVALIFVVAPFGMVAIVYRKLQPSYLLGHPGISRASSRHAGGKGRLHESDADPGRVLPVYSGDRAVRFSRAVVSRRTGLRVPVAEGELGIE